MCWACSQDRRVPEEQNSCRAQLQAQGAGGSATALPAQHHPCCHPAFLGLLLGGLGVFSGWGEQGLGFYWFCLFVFVNPSVQPEELLGYELAAQALSLLPRIEHLKPVLRTPAAISLCSCRALMDSCSHARSSFVRNKNVSKAQPMETPC